MTNVQNVQFRPLHDRILVKVIEEEVMASGIVIPDNAKEKPCRGEVIAVGNGKYADNGQLRVLDVKVGDIVIFSKYSGTEVKLDDQGKRLVLREDDVLGVVEM